MAGERSRPVVVAAILGAAAVAGVVLLHEPTAPAPPPVIVSAPPESQPTGLQVATPVSPIAQPHVTKLTVAKTAPLAAPVTTATRYAMPYRLMFKPTLKDGRSSDGMRVFVRMPDATTICTITGGQCLVAYEAPLSPLDTYSLTYRLVEEPDFAASWQGWMHFKLSGAAAPVPPQPAPQPLPVPAPRRGGD